MTFLAVQQRFFPSLRIGLSPSASAGAYTGVKIHCRQGEWDSACGLHCAAMVLTLLGRLNGTSTIFRHRRGVGAVLWKFGKESYFEGISAEDLAILIKTADSGIRVSVHKSGSTSLLKKTKLALNRGSLVIMNWCSANGQYDHWVVAVGVEGFQIASHFDVRAILCLDPGEPEPVLSGYNGRLEGVIGKGIDESDEIDYLTTSGGALRVELRGVVMITDNNR